ncbi:MAG TPA: hypothetical protein VEL07_03080 [Planctomycetota bacterium]|nr:hypothetical protein [Planctomycetota bacterium]
MALSVYQSGSRLQIGNDLVRLDFDLRTSDTMYNYVLVWNEAVGAFERRYNFGVDVGARERGGTEVVNTVGVHLEPRVARDGDAVTLELAYPSPLVVYRQFEHADDGRETWSYPDLPRDLARQAPPGMRVADGALVVRYRLRDGEAAFTVDGRHLGGPVHNLCAILNAMWVDNDEVMTDMHVEHIGDFAWDRPAPVQRVDTVDVRYALFWRRDGRGVPFAAVIEGRQRQHLAPYTNPDGAGCFRACSMNQAFRPRRAPTTGFNDVNLYVPFEPSRGAPAVRWALLPELACGRGGTGDELLARLRERVEARHCAWWDGCTRQPSAELSLRLWQDARRAPATVWR